MRSIARVKTGMCNTKIERAICMKVTFLHGNGDFNMSVELIVLDPIDWMIILRLNAMRTAEIQFETRDDIPSIEYYQAEGARKLQKNSLFRRGR